MNYIILDMEWNQGYPGQLVCIGDTRRALTGEIIQIGAVKLNDSFQIVDRYVQLVRPTYYPRLHHKVKELTGISAEQLRDAPRFVQVLPAFLEWCGEPFQFLIWGFDDISVLKQNIAVNQMDIPEDFEWFNLQLIYNRQIGAENRQVALQTACETLSIPQDLQLHNALHDAIYTAEVCGKLNMEEGLSYCRRMKQNAEESCKKRFRYYGFDSEDDALQFAQNSDNICPLCGGALTLSGKYVRKFVNQYTALRTCEKHGFFVENIGISKMNEKAKNPLYKAIKSILRSSSEEEAKKQVARRRRRRRKKPAATAENVPERKNEE